MKNVADVYPLSPLQASLLQHHLAAPGSGVGFEQSTVTLRGTLDTAAFERAWRELVTRHPILRTAFVAEGVAQPLQLVRQTVTLDVLQEDWRDTPEAEQETRLDAFLAADRERGFDVRRAPLLRVALLRRAEDRYQFVWSYHHLLLDGWCRALVMEDLFALYDAASRGVALPTTPRRPYRDYIAWLKQRDASATEAFWRQQLEEVAGATPLPDDRRSISEADAEADDPDWVDTFVDAATVAELQQLATSLGVTVATLVQGAWALLLAGSAGLDDVVLGTTVSGRPTTLPGSDAMLGMFINNLPVRLRVPRDSALGPWLRQVQSTLLALGEHEASAPETIRTAAEVDFERRFFDSLVLVQNYPLGDVGEQLGARSLQVEGFRFRLETAYPLTLVVAPADGLQLRLHFDRRRYSAATAQPLVERFRQSLLAFRGDSDRRLLEVLGPLDSSPTTVEGVAVVPEPWGAPRWRAGEWVDPKQVAERLAEHPDVAESLAFFAPAKASPEDADRLLAVVVPATGAPRGEALDGVLRRALRPQLPSVAQPEVVLQVDALPSLGSEPGLTEQITELCAQADAALAAARRTVSDDPVEAVLVDLWSEVLGLPRIDPEADFFELGGHSLLAQRLVSRVREAFGIELSPRALFEQPTLTAMRRQVVALRQEGAGSGAQDPIPRAERDAPLPLSFAQERLWFMHQLEPESSAYNSPRALTIDGPLDLAALAAATSALARRHESLRTRFPSDADARPLQVIEPPAEVPLPLVDLTGLAETRREAEARRWFDRRARQPFDLAEGPLFRTLVARLDTTRHAVLFDLHHIVSDGWSMDVLIREVQALYGAAHTGAPSPLPALPIQVADHAAWQKSPAAASEAQLAYWRRQLAGLSTDPLLTTDHPRGEARGFRGADLMTTLDPAVSEGLIALGRGEGATLFMTVLAVFDLLLHRLTGTTDVALGTDVAGRDRVELEGLIGFFVNNLVLRTDLGGNPSFRQLLGRVKETTLDAFVHQQVPFDQVVKTLGVPRDPARTPLFQVLFVLQNTPRSAVRLPDLTLRPMATTSTVSKFDLAVFLAESEEGLLGKWTYDTDLFEAATIRRLAARFEHLARQVVEQPDAPLSRFELDAAPRRSSRRSAERLRSRRRRTEVPQ